ncbi:uncharacterized protein LAESUDRAFT_737883 [Laetiporus sulphureus 93-53]|uniref:Queuosine 5'-phosphate N-glycosylase/hydrolase n=1 Tax=Laetiporus sulphureus 93-53 TaxID=1314785 RepID=A0A165DE82_9APHY|nr:uncharacterized protein LAESUDRAFT_737883 [Laetiporus sulphureus 93-53]KZT04688.1 hypothetical protein LAESUDRAFT_737883 [Laetiporus sulphureus 93-53]
MTQLPANGGYVRSIREDAIKHFLLSPAFTQTFDRLRTAHGYTMPLNFPSALVELNLISILSLLNFGSGYRVPLHTATGRGAFDNIRAFVFGLYISSATGTGEGDYLSAKGMRDIREHTVADLMGVAESVHVERAHESIPAVTVGELGGPVWELVQLVTETMNETGSVLVDTGYPDLGSFVLEALKEGERAKHASSGDDPNIDCDVVLERLVRVIPAFRDMATVNKHPIYCFKKALLTIHAIALRFGPPESSSSIPVPRTADLPIFVDNVIPSLLVHLGVIDLSTSEPLLGLSTIFPDAGKAEQLESLLSAAAPPSEPDTKAPQSKEVPKEGPILSVQQAYILRAAAIDACELIVHTAHEMATSGGEELAWLKDITAPELDAWLWAVAKDREDYRKLERFVLRNTPYF